MLNINHAASSAVFPSTRVTSPNGTPAIYIRAGVPPEALRRSPPPQRLNAAQSKERLQQMFRANINDLPTLHPATLP
jgi:hypothetical protein